MKRVKRRVTPLDIDSLVEDPLQATPRVGTQTLTFGVGLSPLVARHGGEEQLRVGNGRVSVREVEYGRNVVREVVDLHGAALASLRPDHVDPFLHRQVTWQLK